MVKKSIFAFSNDNAGVSTIEFVVLISGILALVFFVLETTLYLFFSASLNKAAQAGVRAAVVSTPVIAGLPVTNQRTANGNFGINCSDASAPCETFAAVSCSGNSCDAAEFDRIFAHMNGFSGQLQPANVTISYEPTGLGFAGGPTIPLVTVTVSGVPFRTGIVGLLLTNTGVLSSLPTHSVSMTGEDLDRGGAGA